MYCIPFTIRYKVRAWPRQLKPSESQSATTTCHVPDARSRCMTAPRPTSDPVPYSRCTGAQVRCSGPVAALPSFPQHDNSFTVIFRFIITLRLHRPSARLVCAWSEVRFQRSFRLLVFTRYCYASVLSPCRRMYLLRRSFASPTCASPAISTLDHLEVAIDRIRSAPPIFYHPQAVRSWKSTLPATNSSS